MPSVLPELNRARGSRHGNAGLGENKKKISAPEVSRRQHTGAPLSRFSIVLFTPYRSSPEVKIFHAMGSNRVSWVDSRAICNSIRDPWDSPAYLPENEPMRTKEQPPISSWRQTKPH
jgi:hypothetical protein